ncbi:MULTISPECIES: hypothetical protein [unclassified Rummeliibacillus]|uniref:hypothetical protein n=1 Tax=unclassified Rummeliibacillus TaxID=2622809 RepID=UPI0018F31A48|nr:MULTISPECIES: hypothetical protein [unclassified Rummeliibacillus]
MKDPKKAKWLVGSSAVLLSGLLLTQMNGTGALNTNNNATTSQQTAVNQSTSPKTEKELLQLDWTNFQVTKEPSEQNSTQPSYSENQGTDRMTQRS